LEETVPYIIAAGTFVGGFFSTGVQSVNFSSNANIQRLFQLGSSSPYDQNVVVERQLSVVVYGGSTTSYSLPVSEDCDDAPSIDVSVQANTCEGGEFSLSADWFVESYSYSKDVRGWGMETWGLRSKPILLDEALEEVDVDTRMIRGIAEGQHSTDGGADPGITLDDIIDQNTVPGVDFLGNLNVRAEAIGIGRANEMAYGVVTAVGGSTGKADGQDGQGSARIPYSPIYLGT
jgi:hypothetical protein